MGGWYPYGDAEVQVEVSATGGRRPVSRTGYFLHVENDVICI